METQQTPPERMGSLTESAKVALAESRVGVRHGGGTGAGLGHRPGDAAAPRSGDGLGKHPPGSRHGLLPELWASGPGLWGVKLAPGSNLGQ